MMPDADRLNEDKDEFAPFAEMIPEHAVAEVGVRVVGYIDEDGETKFSYEFHGDSQNSKIIGLIEMAKLQWMHDWNFHGDDDDG